MQIELSPPQLMSIIQLIDNKIDTLRTLPLVDPTLDSVHDQISYLRELRKHIADSMYVYTRTGHA